MPELRDGSCFEDAKHHVACERGEETDWCAGDLEGLHLYVSDPASVHSAPLFHRELTKWYSTDAWCVVKEYAAG